MNLKLSTFTRAANRLKGRGANPERDWGLLLITAAVLLVIIIGWNVWAFETVVGGGTLGNKEPSTASTTSASALDTIGTLLDQRATEDANYINGVYRFTDPSL